MRTWWSRSRPGRLLAVVRVLSLLGLCLGVSLALVLHNTHAKAGDILVELGTQLMRLPDARYANGVQQLSLNGLSLMLQSGSSDQEASVVVRQFREACQSRAAIQLDEQERGALGPLFESRWFQDMTDGVMVQERADGTSVVCIDTLGKPWDVASITEAAERFVASGDLMELGQLRYAWVRPAQTGSVFLTFWTDGSARLLEQFPVEGDAPGVDFDDVKRVDGSQRFLSAVLGNSKLAIYRHRQGTLDALADAYDRAMEAAGYRKLEQPATGDGKRAMTFVRGEQHAAVVQQRDERGHVLVTLVSQP